MIDAANFTEQQLLPEGVVAVAVDSKHGAPHTRAAISIYGCSLHLGMQSGPVGR